MGIAAAAIAAAGAVIGGGISAYGASSAANTEAGAANYSANLQEGMYQQTRASLQPFIAAGQSELPALQAQPGASATALNTAFNNAQNAVPTAMTQAQLVNTPGYQFQVAEGSKALGNQLSSLGLGNSGTLAKSLDNFNTGLASSNYQQQFTNQQAIYNAQSQQFSNQYNNQGLQYNQLSGIANMGENAAAGAGYIGSQTGANIGQSITNAGIASGTGIATAANSGAGSINSAANSLANYYAYANSLNGTNPLTGAANPSAGSPGYYQGIYGTGSGDYVP